MAEQGCIHAGHRRRMKERLIRYGYESFSPHEIIELLLFYAIPQKDVNELSHRLIERFGSVTGVLEADFGDLLTVDGIGENTAALFRLVCETLRYYSLENCEKPAVYDSIDKIGQYFVNLFVGLTVERSYAMLFDNRMRLIDTVLIAEGSVNSVGLPPRVIAEHVIRRNASAIVITHNHPHGTAIPSNDDYSLTFSLEQTLKNIGITLIEHLVVSGKFYTPILGARKKALLAADSPAADTERFYGNRSYGAAAAADPSGDWDGTPLTDE